MKSVLEPWVGEEIGCNISKPFHVDPVTLEAVTDSYFVVIDHFAGNHHYVSYNAIVKIMAKEGGVSTGGLFEHRKSFPLVVKIGHILEYVPA